MTDYLVDTSTKQVLLLVKGPIVPQPGQKIVQASEEIPPRLARYDAKSDTVVRITESTFKRRKKKAKKELDAQQEAIQASGDEFRELWAAQTPELRKLLRLMITLPDDVLERAMGEEDQD